MKKNIIIIISILLILIVFLVLINYFNKEENNLDNQEKGIIEQELDYFIEKKISNREVTRSSHMVVIGTAVYMAVVDGLDCDGSPCTSVVDVLACNTATPKEFDDICSSWVEINAPQDPQGGNYLIEEDDGRLKVWSPAPESEWYCGGGNICTGKSKIF